MGDEAAGGAPKKLSTKDILAAARAAAGKATDGGAPPPAAAAPAPEPAPAESVPAESVPGEAAAPVAAPVDKPAVKPAAKPSSTADILAAARAAKAGGATAQPAAPATPAAKPAAAAAGGAKPKSTADILAAARAAKAAGAAALAAASAAPAAAKPAAKAAPKTAAAAAEGPQLSVGEMLAAVRPGAGAAVRAAGDAEAPELPTVPQKPLPAKKPVVVEQRRSVLSAIAATVLAPIATPFAAAWTMFTTATAAATLGTARFMLPNVLTEPPRKFKIGPPSDYDLGTVATKWVAQYGIWVVHTDQYKGQNTICALIAVCTHLGCTPSWLEGEQKFKCPCHGSGFYITGINFEGPAPRPLERAGIRVAEDGMLEVDKSLKFQEEMGQWESTSSYVAIT